MTASNLIDEFLVWKGQHVFGDEPYPWARFVIDVVIPRETSKAGEECFNHGYTEGYENGRSDGELY